VVLRGKSGGLSSGWGGMVPEMGWCPLRSAYLPSEQAARTVSSTDCVVLL